MEKKIERFIYILMAMQHYCGYNGQAEYREIQSWCIYNNITPEQFFNVYEEFL